MTNQEAIAELQDIFINALEFKDIRTQRAFDMAIEALEKQIPKKPFHSGVTYDCPKCLRTVGHITRGGNLVKEHHCICGQAIDWSEKNDPIRA